ncbi:MAG: ATP-dependent DNA helicase [Candidatus Woesearchaeota archaeon]
MVLFPHETVRPSQQALIDNVNRAVKKGTDLLIHAPTGLGKTAAALAPALTQALDQDKTVFFLTSRHTQHEIALKTLKDIRDRHGTSFQAVDVIGKKWMCLQPGVERLPSQEFTEFCRAMREDGKCEYYDNLKKGEQVKAKGKLALQELKQRSPVRTKEIIKAGESYGVCPYYTSLELAKEAKVIIGDYYYVFHPTIREQFFTRSENELEDAVIIVDEAHNLPDRIKNLASSRLSSVVLEKAVKEARKHEHAEVANKLEKLLDILRGYGEEAKQEQGREIHVKRERFEHDAARLGEYDAMVEELQGIGDAIREESQVSFIGAVAGFLEAWQGKDDGFTRIASVRPGKQRGEVTTLSYRCLDPSLVSQPVIRQAHSTILMSGTLTPTSMYEALLGFDDADQATFPSPFPEKNRLGLIIPKTSTKYATRGEEQYKAMADIIAKSTNAIPGNSAVFFPSYYLLQEVAKHVQTQTDKTVFTEQREMTTQDKQEFLDNFRRYKDSGAVLLGVITGNFGEGIDLPGDELKGVIIVGLPLQRPDLETKALIDYYDEKFKKGWDYGYVFPAFNKTMQSAGRCIRSETDRGVIIFLDERYAWPRYKRCFPADWDVKISLRYENLIENFFKQ